MQVRVRFSGLSEISSQCNHPELGRTEVVNFGIISSMNGNNKAEGES